MGYEIETQKLYKQWVAKDNNKDLISNQTNDIIKYPLDNNFQTIIRTIDETAIEDIKSTKIKVSNLTKGALMPVGYIYEYAQDLDIDKKYFPFIEWNISFDSGNPFSTFVEVESDDYDPDYFRIIQRKDSSTVYEGYYAPVTEVYKHNTSSFDIVPAKFIDDGSVKMDWKKPAYLCSVEWCGLPTDSDGIGPFKMDPALIVSATVIKSAPYSQVEYQSVQYDFTSTIEGPCVMTSGGDISNPGGSSSTTTSQTRLQSVIKSYDNINFTSVTSWPVNVSGNSITVQNWTRSLQYTPVAVPTQLLTGWITYTAQSYIPPDMIPVCQISDYGHGIFETIYVNTLSIDYAAPILTTQTGSVFDATTVLSVVGIRQKLTNGKWYPDLDMNGSPVRTIRAIPGSQITSFVASELKGYVPTIHRLKEYDPAAGPDSEDPNHPFNTSETFSPFKLDYPDSLNPVRDDPLIPLIPTFNGQEAIDFTTHWPNEPRWLALIDVECDVWVNPEDYPHPMSQRLGYVPKVICRPPQISNDPLFNNLTQPGDIDPHTGLPVETYESHFYASTMQMFPATKEVIKKVLMWSPDDFTSTKDLKSYTPENDTTIKAKFTAKIKSPRNYKKTEKYQ